MDSPLINLNKKPYHKRKSQSIANSFSSLDKVTGTSISPSANPLLEGASSHLTSLPPIMKHKVSSNNQSRDLTGDDIERILKGV